MDRQMMILLAILVLGMKPMAFADVSDAYCDQTFGGALHDYANKISPACDDGYVIAGMTGYDGGGNGDALLIKTDKHLNIEWSRTYDGGPGDAYWSAAVAGLEGGLCTGYVLIGTTGGHATGDEQIRLIKTDLSGNELNSCTFGGAYADRGGDVVQSTDEKHVFTAHVDYAIPNNSTGDIWLVKTHFDPAGPGCVIDWQKRFDGLGGGDSVRRVIRTTDGYALLGATAEPAETWKAWLIRTDDDGDTLCDAKFDDRQARSGLIQTQPDGGFVITTDPTNGSTPGYDGQLIKTDSDCNPEWTFTRDGGAEEGLAGVIQTQPDNGYLAVGHTYSYGSGEDDVWLMKISSSGVEEWFQVFGGSNRHHGVSLLCRPSEVTPDQDDYLLAGWTMSFGAGNQDVWLLNYNPDYDCHDCDRDGYGDPAGPACVHAELDCDDSDPDVNPGIPELSFGDPVCSDGIDNDCDGNADALDPDCDPPPDHWSAANAQAASYGSGSLSGSGSFNSLALLLLPVGVVAVLRFIRRRTT